MFAHVESGSCPTENDIQVVNALVSECPAAHDLVIRSRDSFLRAGAPRDTATKADLDSRKNIWKCPYCKRSENLLTAADLTRHIQEQKCSTGYPDVLKCHSCESTFSKLSKLAEHLESKSCKANLESGPPAVLVEYLKNELPNPMTKVRMSGLNYGLRTDPLQPGLLYVKVTQNRKLPSQRVPPH